MYLKKQTLTFITETNNPKELNEVINKEQEKGFTLIERKTFPIDEMTKVYYKIVLVFERP